MNLTYIIGILGITVILYLIGSLRMLRQYERGVVFLLGKFESVRSLRLPPVVVSVLRDRIMTRPGGSTRPAR